MATVIVHRRMGKTTLTGVSDEDARKLEDAVFQNSGYVEAARRRWEAAGIVAVQVTP